MTVLVAATAAVSPSPARAATTTAFTPVADAAVYSGSPAANFGSAPRLVADDSPKTRSFLRFAVGGLSGPVTGARLRLWVTDKSSNGPEVRRVTSAWDESTVTYDTRPSVGSSALGDVGSVVAGTWLEYDVGALVTGEGTIEMALVGDSSDGTDFASREDANAAHWPQLVVESGGEPPPPPPPPPPPGDSFSFGLIGDTGYTSSGVTKFLNVRDAMNDAGLAFTVHVGDFKSGSDPCPDSVYTTNRDRFDGFDHPLVYTPGDNEWRDCSGKLDRLAFLRKVFYPDDQSRGTPSRTLERQSADFPENAMWQQGPITFATVHTVGSDNNAGQTAEFNPRNSADIAWMRAAFAAARERNSAAVVIATQANPGFPPDYTSRSTKTGFRSLLEALRSEVQAWGRPVVFVHGDTHTFRIDHPTVLGTALPNFTRVEVFGPSDEHWVRADYDPTNPAVFRIAGR